MPTSANQTLTSATLDLLQLPDDVATLKGMIAELVQALDEQQQHNAHIQGRLALLLHRLYGRRSERLDPRQLSLFDADANADAASVSSATVSDESADRPQTTQRRRGSHGRQRLPEHLQRQEVRHELAEAERACPCCGQSRTPVGEEVSEQLEYVPASFVVWRHVRVTYFCQRCERHDQRPQPTAAATSPATDSVATVAGAVPPSSAAIDQLVYADRLPSNPATPTASGSTPPTSFASEAPSMPAAPAIATDPDIATDQPSEMSAATVAGALPPSGAAIDQLACADRLPSNPATPTASGSVASTSFASEAPSMPAAPAIATSPDVATDQPSEMSATTTAASCVTVEVATATANPASLAAMPVAKTAASQPEQIILPTSTFITAPMPPQPIAKCLAGPGLLAYIIVNKFADHLPLYRQEGRLQREGVWLARSTQCDWLAGCAALLKPLYNLMWQRVLASHELHTDDTPVAVQGQKTKGRLWVYFGDWAHPYTVYDFTLNRSGDRPQECLASFKGYLHADAYAGYDRAFTADCIEVGCWAHARRYFYEARATDPVRATCVLASIGRLYELEAAAKYAAQTLKLSVQDYWEVRLQLRERQAEPILSKLGEYAERQRGLVLPRSTIGEAFTYLHNQWEALRRYSKHGFLDIDNNVAEQALRAIAVGRKNWLFLGSEEGGRTAATLYSFVQTCKRHGLDPWYYLREVLTILPGIEESARDRELPKLLPDVWAARQRAAGESAIPP